MSVDQEKVAVLGLGYVGLPVALGFARAFPGTVGFDIDAERVAALRQGLDRTGEVSAEDLQASSLRVSSDRKDLTGASLFVVTVPTPIDASDRPDLRPLKAASRTVGEYLSPGALVVYESTVYPGVTEDICAPILAEVSGLSRDEFRVGYSPERINPGDREHTLERIVKVVSGEDGPTSDRVARAYERVVHAGVFRAASIRVAEAAKVIENTQRDLNIAFLNELALIFDRLGLRTRDVLAAAGTKWNFLPFRPGLVGGHCIGVDPYYLTAKAEEVGYHPQVILAGRRINDGMGTHVAQKLVKLLFRSVRPVQGARVAILGLTFKENVPDIRNSRVPDIIAELREFGIDPLVHDPLADAREVSEQLGQVLCSWDEVVDLDALVLAVPHAFYHDASEQLASRLRPGGVLMDVKSALEPESLNPDLVYWSL